MSSIMKELLILNGKGNINDLGNWNCIYSRSNESILNLFENIDLKNKEVLTVLASSDYLFSSLVGDVKNIEAFDINPLTFRYYYLRKWILETNRIDGNYDQITYDELVNLVEKHLEDKNQDAKETAYIWYKYMSDNIFYSLYSQAIFESVLRPNTIYDDKIEKLNGILKDFNLVFYNTDINSDNIINKTYDTILLSNILDYCDTLEKLEYARDKLDSLLNKNGEIIISRMLVASIPFEQEKELFSERFKYDLIFEEEIKDFGINHYYKYIKR